MFRDLIPLLADRFHLVAPDYPGFGYSARPRVTEFDYTFDHLTDVMEHFVDALGLERYALYMQDFGGPARIRALIIQNANAYDEGVSQGVRDVVLRVWKEHTPETEANLKQLFELPATKRQCLEGALDPSKVSPDAWEHAQWGMDSGMPNFANISRRLSSYGERVTSYSLPRARKRIERI